MSEEFNTMTDLVPVASTRLMARQHPPTQPGVVSVADLLSLVPAPDLSGKADIGHDHDGDYAPLNHFHDGVYAYQSHQHNELYSLLTHTHSEFEHVHEEYAALTHTHEEYAGIVHDHEEYLTESEILEFFGLGGNHVAVASYVGNNTFPRNIPFTGDFTGKAVFGVHDGGTIHMIFDSIGVGMTDAVTAFSSAYAVSFPGDNYFTIPTGNALLNASGVTYTLLVLG